MIRALALLLVIAIAAPAAGVGNVRPERVVVEGPDVLLAGDPSRHTYTARAELVVAPVPMRKLEAYYDGAFVDDGTASAAGDVLFRITSGLKPRGQHALEVRAAGPFGPAPADWRGESGSFLITLVDPPAAPLALAAHPLGDAPGIRLTWSPPADDGGLALDGYVVERRAPGDADYVELGRPAQASWDDLLVPGVAASYRVVARHALAEGPAASLEVVGPPLPRASSISVSALVWACDAEGCVPIEDGNRVDVPAEWWLLVDASARPFNGSRPIRFVPVDFLGDAEMTTLCFRSTCYPYQVAEEGGTALTQGDGRAHLTLPPLAFQMPNNLCRTVLLDVVGEYGGVRGVVSSQYELCARS